MASKSAADAPTLEVNPSAAFNAPYEVPEGLSERAIRMVIQLLSSPGVILIDRLVASVGFNREPVTQRRGSAYVNPIRVLVADSTDRDLTAACYSFVAQFDLPSLRKLPTRPGSIKAQSPIGVK